MQGITRVPARQLGFLPQNRGSLGITPFHAHEIANDRLVNGTCLRRYNFAKVVVLGNKGDAVRDANRLKSYDPLMPKYTPEIQYGCMTLTHFTHSQRLAEEGGRSLFNLEQHMIKWKDGDEEGQMIGQHGICCAIYREELLDDPEALAAIMREDNVNAEISMKEDTMATFGLLDCILRTWAQKQKKEMKEKGEASSEPQLSERDFLVLARKTIQGSNFNKEATLDLIRFRLACLSGVCEVLVGLGLGLGAWARGVGPAAWGPAMARRPAPVHALGPSVDYIIVELISGPGLRPGLGPLAGFGLAQ